MPNTFPYAYIRKSTCKTEDAQISIMCKAVQYGLGVFSGVRGHWNATDKNLYLFRIEDHFKRLKESALITGMTLNMEYPEFLTTVTTLIKKNKAKCDVYIRPTLYAASEKLTPRFDNSDDDLALYMMSLKDYFNSADGLSVCVSSWRRFDDDAISSKAKITGAYCNSALAKTEAINNGYDEPIFLNRDGKVCEASGANIFGVKNGEVFTPPLSANNLNGITRRSVIELFENEMGLRVREENVDRSMLYTFDELFFTGTAAKISWIREVDKRKVGNGKMGKYSKQLLEIFNKITVGEMPKYDKWLTSVY